MTTERCTGEQAACFMLALPKSCRLQACASGV